MNKTLSLSFLTLALLLSADRLQGQTPLVIGGFDTARCDAYSIPSGSAYGQFRQAVSTAFSGTTFTATSTLTPAFLSTIDILMIAPGGAQANGLQVTNKLTDEEKTALLAFVSEGGRALIMVDNWNFGGGGSTSATDPVNQSFVSPFQLHVTGKLGNPENALTSAGASNHPVMNGPFGVVSTLEAGDPGWFDALGPFGAKLMQFSNGFAAVAVANSGSITPKSGAVVFLSDMNALDDARFYKQDNRMLALNAVAYLAESPAFYSYGSGCPGSGGIVPQLSLSGSANPGGQVQVSLTQGVGSGTALIFLGLKKSATPMGFGCTLNVAPVLPLIAGPFPLFPFGAQGPGAGSISFPADLPAGIVTPTKIALQAFIADGGVTSGFSSTNGVELTIH